MGYYNMIFQYNENKFLNDCKKAGVNELSVLISLLKIKFLQKNVKNQLTLYSLYHLQLLKIES